MSCDCNCKNNPCDCHEPVDPMSGLALSAGTSTVVGARINKGTARELARYCHTHNCTQSSVLRKFVISLAKAQGSTASDEDATLTTIREALALPEDAGQSEIAAAIDALFAVVGDPAAEPIADPLAAPAAPAPKPDPLASRLSRDELAFCSKKGITPSQFYARKQLSVRRAGAAEPAARVAPAAPAAIALSKEQAAACQRRGKPATLQGWRALKAAAARGHR